MKLTVLTAILASSKAIAFAAPEGVSFVKASSLSQRDIDNAVPLTFIGQAFIDGPNVTLTGTAETIYHRLLEINPAYNEWDFPEYRERMGALGFTKESLLEFQHAPSADASKLRKRQHNPNPISVWCGNQVGDVYDIAAVCERERTSYVWSLLGQIFRDGPPAWNTVVRAQTC
ncbi:hypothetical protein K4K52_006500 [Colletotrichum sp. SAR 10_76]|nr:hypothetical protein K4K52_006500 [Colletotrichum sp. SAR 10_76]